VVCQIFNEDSLSISVDVGFRYISTDSHIKARNSDQPAGNRYELEYDDASVFRLGASADYVVSSDVIWSFGLSYQGDLTNGDIHSELGPLVENTMEAFLFETALRLAL
jgi:hypothetical protein